MTTPLPETPPGRRLPPVAAVLELFGLLLLLVAVAGAVTVAFLAHPLAGWAALCALAGWAGWRLSTREV